jgi:hypothetical protein
MKVDLTGVEAWEGAVILPPGEYLVEVDDATEETSGSGHPQIKFEMRAVGGEQEGGTIRDWVTITAQSLGRVKQVLDALGVADLDTVVSFEPAELVGKRCRIVVRNEMYEGKERTKVKAYQPAGAATNGHAAPTGTDVADLPF